ncbi:glutamate--tRNA ligase [Adlercreutzia sp. ZJ242]|uniref:glutamate--tRNA ligase n=1 Tax=Adlercreutzia sp. ZJ242 TaxID=2709409 RepID=UPI0013EBB734|nr:glutamate--tRNA ligase [Adlercreutzia sp. ZJ242]
MTNKPVRVRFAPSPTGKLHIGGARTAIYNWAFARATGGTFVLRIEDTDPERSTEENTQIILRALRWLGLDWDEGPEVGGSAGPYFQMQRMDTYAAALERLRERGAAYACFCTKDELDAKRAKAEAEQGGYAGYDGTCRDLPADEVEARIAAGEPHVWRLRVPKDHGPIEFDDAVYGHMAFPAEVMDDMILVRTDGSPTYNFAVVCDDANMGITHVIRGDDHLSNTPRQILIYEALGYDVPTFAHLSMILGADGKKLSKRHGATNVEEYRDRGYLPDALVNFLALLGWSLDGETTIIDRATLCREFSLDRITKKDAVFDETKLDWMNGVYIREMDVDAWTAAARPWLAAARADGEGVPAGVTVAPTPTKDELAAAARETHVPGEGVSPEVWEAALAATDEAPEIARGAYPLVIERLSRLNEIPAKLAFLFWGPNVMLDEKSLNKVLKKEGARADEALAACRAVLADEGNAWDAESLQEKCRARGEELEIKPKNLFQPLRVAVCGNMVSPPLFESIVLMDRADVLARIDGVADAAFGE